MRKATKTVKAPLTDGFLLSDIRPRGGSYLRNLRPNRKATRSAVTMLTAILVFSFLMTGLPKLGGKVSAESSRSKTRQSNLSSDLLSEMTKTPNGLIQVIIDTKPGANVLKLIAKMGGLQAEVSRSLNKGRSISVQIPAASLLVLSADKDIKYISLDRRTKVAGHLETTSGAAAARSYGTTATGK